jgi:hypothetical protein
MDNIYLERHPLENLKNYSKTEMLEKNFSERFNCYYLKNFEKIHGLRSQYRCSVIREIPVANLGIADMISISWNSDLNLKQLLEDVDTNSTFTLRAFEFKIQNWKKGLMQAHRYSYFSNSTILVIPIELLESALTGYDTFKKLNVGLWGFDSENGFVRKIFTPRPNNNYIEKYFSQVASKASSFLTESQPIP